MTWCFFLFSSHKHIQLQLNNNLSGESKLKKSYAIPLYKTIWFLTWTGLNVIYKHLCLKMLNWVQIFSETEVKS